MSEQVRSRRWRAVLVTGAAIGTVESLLAVAFASIVFGGRLDYFTAEGVGLYLGAAFLTLVFFAWRTGALGVVGSLRSTTVALLTIVAATTGLRARGSPQEGFIAVVAATMIVTVSVGVTFLVLGARRRGDLLRFVPVPVVGGFVAGAGWLLVQGGVHMAIDEPLFYTGLEEFADGRALRLWLPTVAFGVVLLLAVRITKKPLAIPVTIGIGIVGFAVVALATGASIDDVRAGGWLVGPFKGDMAWKTWSTLALTDADWLAVARSWAPIVVAVGLAALVLLRDLDGIEAELDRDLDTNEAFRVAGLLNLVAGALGGIPGFHERRSTSAAARSDVDARRAGLVAAIVPLVALLFGETVLGSIPKMIVGGVLVFLGLSLIVEWVWDRRRSLPRIEYAAVLLIVAVVVARGYMPGVIVGLVLAVMLIAVSYGRIDLVHEVPFGDVYRSSVDRPPAERALLHARAHRVQLLRVSGHMFFGSANHLLERIRRRVEEEEPPRFVVIDLTRVTGVDASVTATLVKAERLVSTHGSEIVLSGASTGVRRRLERGRVLGTHGLVSFGSGLDDALQRCEEALLEGTPAEGDDAARLDGLPSGLAPYLDRVPVAEGTVLLHQGGAPGDIYVLEQGRLVVETGTPEGRRVRVRTLRPGVVVGEIALYSGVSRTADVIAQTPCMVLRCSRERIAQIEADDPETAAGLHRWLAGTLAERLDDTMRTFDALMD